MLLDESVIYLLLHVSCIEGDYAEAEKSIIYSICALFNCSIDVDVIAKKYYEDIESGKREVVLAGIEDKLAKELADEEKKNILVLLGLVALADKKMHSAEMKCLSEICHSLGMGAISNDFMNNINEIINGNDIDGIIERLQLR